MTDGESGAESVREKPQRGARRRSEHSHRAILEAAAELLEERGYAGVAIERIAARAGVGKQTIYRWWPSKTAIFIEIYNECAAQTLSDLDTGSVGADLRNLLRGMFTLFQTTSAGPAMRGMIAEAQSDPEAARAFREEFMVRRRAVTRSILEKGVARGELRQDLDLEVAIDVLTGAVWQRLLQGHAPMNDNYAEGVVEVILPGMLQP